jgi:hypothetical protein
VVFKAINKMEKGLRELIADNESEQFRGVYIEGGVNPTRRNILAPGSIGAYAGGGTYNPAQVLRDQTVKSSTEKIDMKVEDVGDKKYVEMPIDEIQKLIQLTMPDDAEAERVWDAEAIAGSIQQFAKLRGQKTGYLYVDRDRGLKESRRETQGILEGGEAGKVPQDKLTLFLLRTKAGNGANAAWWPQLRFPAGNYAFAFAV